MPGTKPRWEDLSEDEQTCFEAIRKVAQEVVNFHNFPQEPEEPTKTPSMMFGASTAPPTPEVTIPLPDEMKGFVTEARKHRTTKLPLLPPLVRKGYRIPREDWAMLGAVRRPTPVQRNWPKGCYNWRTRRR